ncbi:ScyD/ScyE family protein [Kineococcus glutinatus]|uniref:ScyD/ScyE family protein n=1 Tax=Kineococcus glutinatus TaxID=1070872 RepID=A0ABP9HHV4_9ACTN
MRRRTTTAATLLALTCLAPAAPATATTGEHDPAPVVVATGLDNPRQLGWDRDGASLLVAEAGSGGDTCAGEGPQRQCAGLTGAVGLVHDPGARTGGAPHRVVTGLASIAAPDGSFAVGSDGAAATELPGIYAAAMTYVPPEAFPGVDLPGGFARQLGSVVLGGHGYSYPVVDLAAAEARLNPDGAQVESNPYGILVVPRTATTPTHALVADAAANTVWRVGIGGDLRPRVSVFATYPTPPDDDTTPEFVPTSLARDADGNVYVGGLGSEQPGAAQVVKYSAGGRELHRWTGFTGVTGVAVAGDGTLYVSQLFGAGAPGGGEDGEPVAPNDDVPGPGPGAPGDVVRVAPSGERTSVPVPFPAGLAVDEEGAVYVSAWSVSDADGAPAGPAGPATPGGQIWRLGS